MTSRKSCPHELCASGPLSPSSMSAIAGLADVTLHELVGRGASLPRACYGRSQAYCWVLERQASETVLESSAFHYHSGSMRVPCAAYTGSISRGSIRPQIKPQESKHTTELILRRSHLSFIVFSSNRASWRCGSHHLRIILSCVQPRGWAHLRLHQPSHLGLARRG